MRRHLLACTVLGIASLFACTKSEMRGNEKGTMQRNAAQGLGDPDGPGQCKTDCTDLDAKACSDKKQKEQCDNSYRNVDCDGESSKECSKLVDEERGRDGENGSEIMVKECLEDDDGKRCDKIEDKPNTTVVSRSGESDGNDGPGGKSGEAVDCSDLSKKGCDKKKAEENADDSFRTVDCAGKTTQECQALTDAAQGVEDGDKVKVENCPDEDDFCDELDAQDDTDVVSRDKGAELEESDDSISVGLVKWCAGGPVNAVYPFKDEDDARDCMESIKQPSSVNSSGACATDARFGRCSFKGSAKDRAKKVRKTVPGQCICLTSAIAAQAGISWDGSPGQ
jgi:hypothetical protein